MESNSQFTKFHVLFIALVSLVLTICEILSKNGKVITSYFFGTLGICSLSMNILLRNFWMHLSINFCGYASDKIFSSLPTSWWNFKKPEDKLKQQFNKVCTQPNLYSSGIKLLKLVYTPLNVSFLKTLVTNLSFSQNIFTSRKESYPFISVSIEYFMFLCFLFIYSRKNCACSGLSNKTKISSTYLL